MDGVHPLRFMCWGHQHGWGYCRGLCRGTVGCGAWAWAVDFLASLAVWTCCILYKTVGSTSAQQRSPSPFLTASPAPLPGAAFPGPAPIPSVPLRSPAFLATAWSFPALLACCQRPLVLGWLRGRAWPLKVTQVLGSLGHSWACLWGKEGRKGTLLEVPPGSPLCSLVLRAFLCSLALSLKRDNDPVHR